MLVSYIIPIYQNFNQSLKQIRDINKNEENEFEILLIDDGSQPKLKCDLNNVKLIRNRVNGGPSIARNLGAKNAKSKYLFFIDSDIFIAANSRKEIINEVQNYSDKVLMGVYNPKNSFLNIFSLYKNLYWSFNQINVLKNKNNFCTAIFMISKQNFEKINGFDETLRIGEDREFGERIKKNGLQYYSSYNWNGLHFKQFNFKQLILNHFDNSKSVGYFLLKKFFRNKDISNLEDNFKTNYLQMITIPVSFLIILILILSVTEIISITTFLISSFFLIFAFLFSIKKFLQFVFNHYSLRMCIIVTSLYFIEQIIALIGFMFAGFNLFLERKKKLYN